MKAISPLVIGMVLLAAILLVFTATGRCMDKPATLWNSYASHFINQQGRVVDPQGADRTTSEGQSYALFFALVENDRPRFDRLLEWTQANLAAGDMAAHLPGWLWGKAPDGTWKLLDPSPAADSDCWIAYDLLEAGRLWNQPAYTLLAHRMMARIARQEVSDLPGFGPMLMPGTTALWVHNHVWTLNPCYTPLFIFDRFAQADPAGPWESIAANLPRLLRESNRGGFAMDWVNYSPTLGFSPAPAPVAPKPKPAAPTTPGVAPKQPTAAVAPVIPPAPVVPPAPANPPAPVIPAAWGSYDAIRVYLWAGMLDNDARGRKEILASLSGMAAYLANHDAPPEKVSAEGIPLAQDGPVGFSAAVLPYLRALPGTDKSFARQQDRMGEQLVASTGLYGKDPAYYDQNLALFATGFLQARFRFGVHGELKVDWTR